MARLSPSAHASGVAFFGSPASVALLLIVLTFALYAPVREHSFLNFDDQIYIIRNPTITVELTPVTILSHFSTTHGGNWLPVTMISLHLGRALHGFDPAAFLMTNVALHILAAVLLYAALCRMTGAVWPSAFAAGIFAAHPLHVESVAWVASRKDVLSGVFFMLGLYVYAGYARSPGRGRYAALLLVLALGLMSKVTLVTLPLVLWLLDLWPLRRNRVRVVEKLPMLAMAVAAGGVAAWTQSRGGSTGLLPELDFDARLINALSSCFAYLRDTVWPTGLAALYPHPYARAAPEAADFWLAAAAAAVLLAITLLALRSARSRPYFLVGWLWYLITLAPTSGVLIHAGRQARADRYMYLPLVGLAIIVAWGASDLFGRGTRGRRLLMGAGLACLALLAIVTREQLLYWRDSISLFERAVAATENNVYAHERLAYELREVGRYEEAADQYRAAISLAPEEGYNYFDLALNYQWQGDLDAAIEWYEVGLRVEPQRSRAHAYLGMALIQRGRGAEAHEHLVYALARYKGNAAGRAELQDALAQSLASMERFDEAEQAAIRAAELAEAGGDPELVDIARRRAERYRLGQPDRQSPEPAHSPTP